MSKTDKTKWLRKVSEAYDYIDGVEGDVQENVIMNLISDMDKLRPHCPVKGTIRVKVDPDSGKLEGRAAKYEKNPSVWRPNPGTDPNLHEWRRNNTNGHYVPADIHGNHEWNDVLRLSGGYNGGGRGSTGKLYFYSYRYQAEIPMSIDNFIDVSVNMLRDYLVGRWYFGATSSTLLLRSAN